MRPECRNRGCPRQGQRRSLSGQGSRRHLRPLAGIRLRGCHGAWASFTDAGDDYGEGSFDKGIYVSLPLDAFFTTSTRSHMHMAWSALTRDGGSRDAIGSTT
nr:YjbH domain-containing protein [Halomonas stenophila]